MAKDNKILFGLKNLYLAKQTESVDEETGQPIFTYEEPKAFPGAVTLSADPQGEDNPFYADDVVYYRSVANNGYSGSLEVALVPDWVETEYLGSKVDKNGVLVESADGLELPKCALLFEFSGDAKAVRHALYNVTLSRPSMEGSTKESSISPKTASLDYSADPRADGLVKAKTFAGTDPTWYAKWYQEVYQPQLEGEEKDPSEGDTPSQEEKDPDEGDTPVEGGEDEGGES